MLPPNIYFLRFKGMIHFMNCVPHMKNLNPLKLFKYMAYAEKSHKK